MVLQPPRRAKTALHLGSFPGSIPGAPTGVLPSVDDAQLLAPPGLQGGSRPAAASARDGDKRLHDHVIAPRAARPPDRGTRALDFGRQSILTLHRKATGGAAPCKEHATSISSREPTTATGSIRAKRRGCSPRPSGRRSGSSI